MQSMDYTVILAAIITAGLALAGTYLTTYRRYQEDVPLREKRMQYYVELWKCTGTLLRKDEYTRKDLLDFSQCLRDWYNGEGGLFFSQNSSLAYYEIWYQLVMKETLMRGYANVKKDHVQTAKFRLYVNIKEDDILPMEIVRDVNNALAKLRSALAKDIGTRRMSRLNALKKLFGRGQYDLY